MAIGVVFDGAHIPREKYDEALALGGDAVRDQPARSVHVCFERGEGFMVVDVWDSPEAFERFGQEVIGPVIGQLGLDLTPEVAPLHNQMPIGRDRHVETVAEMYAAFGRGDVGSILDHIADDVVWEDRSDDHGVPWLTPGTGKEHVVRFFETIGAALEFKHFAPIAITGGGEVVLALIEAEVVVRDTGGVIDDLEVHVWTFGDDGKVRSFRHVTDTAQHLRALGR